MHFADIFYVREELANLLLLPRLKLADQPLVCLWLLLRYGTLQPTVEQDDFADRRVVFDDKVEGVVLVLDARQSHRPNIQDALRQRQLSLKRRLTV